jgi:predicted transcriptional regulator
MPAPKLKAEEVEAKLRELAGNYSAVARALGVTRSAVSLFVSKRPKLKAVAEECRETFVDNVESAIYKQALDGNVTAQIFILKTLGKSRGYIEKHELEHSWHKDVTELSNEEIAAEKAAIIAKIARS